MIFTILTNKLGGYYNLRQRFKKTNSKFLKKIYSIINTGFQHETNSYLPFNNSIEGPINFLHGTYGIFISGGAVIGKNCTIYQKVNLNNRIYQLCENGWGYREDNMFVKETNEDNLKTLNGIK